MFDMPLFVVSIIIFVYSLLNVLIEPEVHANWSISVTLLSIFWIVTYILYTYCRFKTFYLLASAYILALSLFHLGTIIPASLGLIDNIVWEPVGYLARWQERSGWFTVLSLSCLGIGVGISAKFSAETGLKRPVVAVRNHALSSIYLDGIGLFVSSLVFLCMAIYSFGNLLNYSRVEFFRTASDTRGLGLFMMVLPSAAVLLAIGARSKIEKIFSIFVALSSFCMFLFSGYRSAALFPALVGIILWEKVGKKISFVFAVSAVAFVIFVIPVIGMLRGMGPYKNINSQTIEKSVKKTSSQDAFIEMGGTAGVLAHVLRLVPDQDPYRFGVTYVKAFRDSIPNIMPKMGESYRTQSRQEAFYDPYAIGSMAVPSDWITYRVARDKFNKGEGLGFSAIGEPYLNFGTVGVVVFFVVLGFLLGRLDGVNLLEHPKLLIFACAMFWPLVRTVRNDFSNFIKPAIFMFIIICIWRLLLGLVSVKSVFGSGSKSIPDL